MIDNAPVRSITHKGLTVEGYSRAAVQSYWRIPELKLGFDLGASGLRTVPRAHEAVGPHRRGPTHQKPHQASVPQARR